jgi:hypothetical protein
VSAGGRGAYQSTAPHGSLALWGTLEGFIERGVELGHIDKREGFEPGEIDTNWLASRALKREMRARPALKDGEVDVGMVLTPTKKGRKR